jgi:AbrB family looped-hinge helix DNA binding protein
MPKMVSITSRGQITIPKEYREHLKLSEVDVIVIVKEGNHLRIQKATEYLMEGKKNENV